MKIPFLSKLFSKAPPPAEEPREGVYLTETVTFGNHLYRRAGDDPSVYFVDTHRGIRKQLVDSRGMICRFPGIVKEEFWVREVSANALRPQICFRSSFSEREDGWIFLWQIQPDGMYWADEGRFGIEPDVEVILYTYVDRNGDFTGPFRIYSMDGKSYS